MHKAKPFTDGGTSTAKERSASHPYRYDDGVTIIAAAQDINPDDNFLS